MWAQRQELLGELGLAGYAKEPDFTLRARGSHGRSKSGQRRDPHSREIPLASGEMSGGECRGKAREPWWVELEAASKGGGVLDWGRGRGDGGQCPGAGPCLPVGLQAELISAWHPAGVQ